MSTELPLHLFQIQIQMQKLTSTELPLHLFVKRESGHPATKGLITNSSVVMSKQWFWKCPYTLYSHLFQISVFSECNTYGCWVMEDRVSSQACQARSSSEFVGLVMFAKSLAGLFICRRLVGAMSSATACIYWRQQSHDVAENRALMLGFVERSVQLFLTAVALYF